MNSQGTLLEGADPDQLQTLRWQGSCPSSRVPNVNPSSLWSQLFLRKWTYSVLRAVTHHRLRSRSSQLSSKCSERRSERTRRWVSCCPLLDGLGSAAICGGWGRGADRGGGSWGRRAGPGPGKERPCGQFCEWPVWKGHLSTHLPSAGPPPSREWMEEL